MEKKMKSRHLIKPKLSFIEFLRKSPLVGIKIIYARNKSRVRKVKI